MTPSATDLQAYFNLKRPLVFLDLEATGLHVLKDRIVQIALVKLYPGDKEPEELSMLINPGIPISEEAIKVHGILPKDLANKPTFQQAAEQLFEFIGDADLAGYNSNRFDIPMLMEEFHRVGYDFDIEGRQLIDVQRIFYKMEPRTLQAAHRFYCHSEMENAHDALADVYATAAVLRGQLEHYKDADLQTEDALIEKPVKNDMKALHQFTNDQRFADVTQRMKYDHKGTLVFNFGKHLGKPVLDTIIKDRNYYDWMMNKDFSVQVKKILQQLMKSHEQSQRA